MLIKSLKSNWTADCPSRVPLYHQLYSALKNSITSGVIELGEQMPTEPQLSKALDISRTTVKRAMNDLTNEGFITRTRGKGSFVIYKYSSAPKKSPLLGVLENLECMGKQSLVKIISVEQAEPSETIGELLGLEKGQEAIKIARTRHGDENDVLAYYESWALPNSRELTQCNVEHQARFSIFSKNDTSIAKVELTLGARNADEVVANILRVANNDALLELRRSHFDQQGNLIDILTGLYNPNVFQYTKVLKAN